MEAVVNNFVEIIGPPGSGKSTLYKNLCKSWNRESNWIYEDALLAPDRPKLFHPFKLLEYTYRKMTRRRMSKSLPADYGLRLNQAKPELPNFLWGALSASFSASRDKDYLRFRAAYFLFQDFSRYQAIIEKNSSLPCLIEEGFLQKSIFIGLKEDELSSLLDKYFSLIPLPKLLIVIYFDNEEVILSRLLNRRKISIRHQEMGRKELSKELHQWDAFNKLIVSKFNDLHIPVKYIKAENQLEDKVGKLRRVLENISN